MNELRLDARRVGLGLRPPRLAVLIGSDCTWGHCIYLIGTLTEIWGGATYAVVPTDGQTISPLFWRLLDRYDPDWLVAYGDSVQVSEPLWAELSNRLSLAEPIGANLGAIWPDNISWPLTEIHECLPDDKANRPVRNLKVEGDLLAQALVYAWAGYLHEGVREGLERNAVEIKDVEIDLPSGTGDLLRLADDLWLPRYRQRGADIPLLLSLQHLGIYTTDATNRCAILAVCGDTLDDFAFFWTLRALRGALMSPNVFWIPRLYNKEGDDDAKRLWPYLSRAVIEQLRDVFGDKRVLATSLSISLSSLDRLGALLDDAQVVRISSEETKSATAEPDDLDQLLPYETRYWEVNNSPRENVSVIQFLDGRGLAILPTPVPKKVSVKHGSDMRWMVDVEVEGLRVPARSSLTRLLVEPVLMADFRVSTHGIAYQAISAFSQPHMTVESMLVRPRMKLPADWQVFETLGRQAGLTLTVSDKGQFEREWIRMVGGLETLGRQLRHDKIVRTLLRFIDESPNKKGVFDEGVVIEKRRYLDLRALRKLWNGEENAAETLSHKYLQNGLFQRGLLIKCPHCRKADWYRLAELSDRVVCHRCSREHVFAADAAVYFRLDEIAREAIRSGAQIPLLTLDYLRRRSRESFLYSTGCEVWRADQDEDRPWLEVDLLGVADGDLVVGEAKRGKKLQAPGKEQLGKYVEFCGRFGADRFVVSTDAPEWSEGSMAFLDDLGKRLQGIDVQLVRLTGTDIRWPPVTGGQALDLMAVLGETVGDEDEE